MYFIFEYVKEVWHGYAENRKVLYVEQDEVIENKFENPRMEAESIQELDNKIRKK